MTESRTGYAGSPATPGRRDLLRGAAGLALVTAPVATFAQTAAAQAPATQVAAKIAPPNIIRPGTLVMSINPTLPPLQFVNDRGELQGMRVELGNMIARELGLTPDYVRIEFASMVPGLAAKRWDMINTGIFWTEERSKLMYMVPYERAAVSFLASKGNPLGIARWQDLAGRAVGVELGGIEESRTREVDRMLKAEGLRGLDIRTFNNFAEAFQALRARQVDAATSIDATAMYWQDRGDFTRAIAGLFPQVATFAFANRTLADEVVGVLNTLKADNRYAALLDRYGVLKIEEANFAIRGPGPG